MKLFLLLSVAVSLTHNPNQPYSNQPQVLLDAEQIVSASPSDRYDACRTYICTVVTLKTGASVLVWETPEEILAKLKEGNAR